MVLAPQDANTTCQSLLGKQCVLIVLCKQCVLMALGKQCDLMAMTFFLLFCYGKDGFVKEIGMCEKGNL